MGKLGNQLIFKESQAVVTKTTDFGVSYKQIIPISGTNGKVIDVPFIFMKDNNGAVKLITGLPPKK